MSYSIQWQIKELAREFQSGYVFKIRFIVQASCNATGTSYLLEGSQHLDRPDTLVPYEQLTENLVKQWLYTALSENGVQRLETDAATGLSSCIETVSTELPWIDSSVHTGETNQKGTFA
jgi:hypothetical protein